MTPINDAEVSCPPEELELFSRATNLSELWKREESAIALEKTNWLRLYDFRAGDSWETMFVPNGEGTIEWHLGWELDIPDGYYVLILQAPEAPPGLEIPMGILDAKAVRRLNERQGMAIAIRPRRATRIQRQQSVAKLILLHRDSITVTSHSEP